MSDIGVHSNLYQRAREYADLVDEVLIRLKSGMSDPSDTSRLKLAALLDGLASSPVQDLSAAWLGLVLGRAGKDGREEWVKLGGALLRADAEPYIIEQLQQLARVLEMQRTDALAKMRGAV
jgi:hypothetical protein